MPPEDQINWEINPEAEDAAVAEDAIRTMMLDQRKAEVRDLGRMVAIFAKGMRDEALPVSERRDAIQFFVISAANRMIDQWHEEDA